MLPNSGRHDLMPVPRLTCARMAASNAGISGKDDAQRVDGCLVMLGQIDLAVDRLQKQPLLALAELLVAWFVFGREDLVGLREAALRIASRVMDTKRVGARMRVMVRR